MKEIKNLDELIALVCKKHDESDICNDNLWFRGHADHSWELVPSVQRNEYKGKEIDLTNFFYTRSSVVLTDRPDSEDFPSWLALMQHNGLPTRLLDWTRSPLIAAFFATNEFLKYPDTDACIWMLRPKLLNTNEYSCNYIFPMDSTTIKKRIWPAFGKLKRGKDQDLETTNKDRILACYPVKKDNRVFAQQSAFTIHDTEKKLEVIYDKPVLEKIVIRRGTREGILNELQACGITLSSIFPDSENIANEIKNKLRRQ